MARENREFITYRNTREDHPGLRIADGFCTLMVIICFFGIPTLILLADVPMGGDVALLTWVGNVFFWFFIDLIITCSIPYELRGELEFYGHEITMTCNAKGLGKKTTVWHVDGSMVQSRVMKLSQLTREVRELVLKQFSEIKGTSRLLVMEGQLSDGKNVVVANGAMFLDNECITVNYVAQPINWRMIHQIYSGTESAAQASGQAVASQAPAPQPVSAAPRPAQQAPRTESPERGTTWRICGVSGQMEGGERYLNAPLTLGRSEDCDIVFAVDRRGVSRRHCEVGVKDGRVYLRDLNATYGTKTKNGTLMDGREEFLSDGDTFTLGTTETFRVERMEG